MYIFTASCKNRRKCLFIWKFDCKSNSNQRSVTGPTCMNLCWWLCSGDEDTSDDCVLVTSEMLSIVDDAMDVTEVLSSARDSRRCSNEMRFSSLREETATRTYIKSDAVNFRVKRNKTRGGIINKQKRWLWNCMHMNFRLGCVEIIGYTNSG